MIRSLQRSKVTFVSSFPPGNCGMPTFTSDLISNVGSAEEPDSSPSVVAMPSGHERLYTVHMELMVKQGMAAGADHPMCLTS
jgi:hypothetical protein